MQTRLMAAWFALITFFNMALPFSSFAAETPAEGLTVKIAVSSEEHLRAERILYTAFERMGYNAVFQSMSTKSAVQSVNSGENDVLATQTSGIAAAFPNMLRVPVPVSSIEVIVYTRSDFQKTINKWDDLAGLNVAYHVNSVHVEARMPSAVQSVITRNSFPALFQAVLDGDADATVIPLAELSTRALPDGIVQNNIIEKLDTYSYVNISNPELVTKLSAEYIAMRNDGTLKRIKDDSPKKTGNEKTVLHVSSYNTDMVWEQELVQGLNNALELVNSNVLYYNFPLNLKRISSREAQFELMFNQVRSTFIARDPDVIVVSDNDAMDFITEYYDRLFLNTPVVFCGVNGYTPDMTAGREEIITGVAEDISAAETVDEILKLYPGTKNIFVINDYSTEGVYWRKTLEDQLRPFEDKINFIYNKDEPLVDTLASIRNAGDNSIVLFGSYYRDSTGRYLTSSAMTSALKQSSHYPVFSLISVNVGLGALGGKTVNPLNQGYEAGWMTVRLINGQSVTNLPVLSEPDMLNTWVYDYNIADEYDVNTLLLHGDHVPVNRMLSLYESNPMEVTIIAIFSVMSTLIIVMLLVFTQRQRVAKREMEHIAMHDQLTGLANRTAFDINMFAMFKQGLSGGAMILDMDSFKEVNDVHGHTVGDGCLVEVARRISQSGIPSELSYRVGGDEFFMILFCDRDGLINAAERVMEELRQPFEIGDLVLHVTASIGLAMFPDDGNSPIGVMKNVDLALYRAKELGKNRFYFYTDRLSEKITRQSEIVKALRLALEEGGFYTLYQPEINILDGSIFSFEALLRLNSPELGIVSPGEFIPIAESSGMIYQIGMWVLEDACRFAKKTIADIPDFKRVSVNVSAAQLEAQNFVEDVFSVIEKVGLAPCHLQIEMTESVLMDDAEENIRKLARLQRAGITVALDDFGTAYSSMKYLVELPINTIKIDKSFIDATEVDEKKRAVTMLIVSTAHSLNLNVVAEGVEHEAQRDFLRTVGCDVIQGYLYSMPLSADKVRDFILDNNVRRIRACTEERPA